MVYFHRKDGKFLAVDPDKQGLSVYYDYRKNQKNLEAFPKVSRGTGHIHFHQLSILTLRYRAFVWLQVRPTLELLLCQRMQNTSWNSTV